MAIKYCELSQHPGSMTAEQLRAELGGLDDNKLLRSLVMAELTAIRAGADREIRTGRGLWYALVKPALSRLDRLNVKTKGGNAKDWDKRLSRVLGELVSLGVTTYEEMRIMDGSRMKQRAVRITRPVANVVLTGAHYPHIVLCSEKDTIYSVIAQVAELYGVSCYSGGGQPSKAATENLVLDIMRSEAFDPSTGITILSLTDYDPAGYKIANSFFAQVQESVIGLDRRFPVVQKRLGIEPDQLTRNELLQNAYDPPGGKELREWFSETGGVYDQPLGLELDALPISRLRSMFAEGIETEISLAQRENDLRESALDLVACELLLPGFSAMRASLINAVKQSALWVDMQAREISPDLFRTAAIQGMNSINPIEDTSLFDADAIRDIMGQTLDDTA